MKLTKRERRVLDYAISLAVEWKVQLAAGYDLSGLTGEERRVVRAAIREAERDAERFRKVQRKLQEGQ